MATHRNTVLIVLIILAVASFFRFYQIADTPPGLYPDEAMNGTNALDSLETGDFRVFYPDNNGREGLFITLQAFSIKIFGIHPWSLRIVSALIGVLTILGLFLLTRQLYDANMAYLASFLGAIAFWHVNFSRIGFRAIMVPLILVYAFYFIWKGLQKNNLIDFFWAGLISGLGFYTYTSYRVALFIPLVLFITYWAYLRKDFSHSKYEITRYYLLRGFALFFLVAFFTALPLAIYFIQHLDQFFSRAGEYLSVFHQSEPLKALGESIVKTLGMFNFYGDPNQRHNISGAPMLSLPMSLLFLIGFIKEFMHWIRRKHGHLSPLHTFLFSWFFIMLLPGFLSIEAPHALRTIGVIPVVMIFTARGLWWIFEKFGAWYDIYHPSHHSRAAITMPAARITLVIFLVALSFLEFYRYFTVWGKDQDTPGAFNSSYVRIAKEINALPLEEKKYILVSAGGTIAKGFPVPAQTVMFLTDSGTLEKQKEKNIFYLTPETMKKTTIPKNSKIFELK
ncbi:MAG TPA: glycosyltransferase family 39 protein [Candidatus Paceibacterota bacterium]